MIGRPVTSVPAVGAATSSVGAVRSTTTTTSVGDWFPAASVATSAIVACPSAEIGTSTANAPPTTGPSTPFASNRTGLTSAMVSVECTAAASAARGKMRPSSAGELGTSAGGKLTLRSSSRLPIASPSIPRSAAAVRVCEASVSASRTSSTCWPRPDAGGRRRGTAGSGARGRVRLPAVGEPSPVASHCRGVTLTIWLDNQLPPGLTTVGHCQLEAPSAQ